MGGFYERFDKRLVDVTAAVLLGAPLLPLLLAIGIALRATMGRPVVFRQQRVGISPHNVSGPLQK